MDDELMAKVTPRLGDRRLATVDANDVVTGVAQARSQVASPTPRIENLERAIAAVVPPNESDELGETQRVEFTILIRGQTPVTPRTPWVERLVAFIPKRDGVVEQHR